jgi:hypothetical protein
MLRQSRSGLNIDSIRQYLYGWLKNCVEIKIKWIVLRIVKQFGSTPVWNYVTSWFIIIYKLG